MAKTKTKPKTKTPSLLEQAQAEKDAQYAPQIAQAQALLGDAGSQLKSDIETARNNEQAVRSFAEAQKVPTIERYKGAQGNVAGFQANTDAAIKPTGAGNDIFRNALASEQGSLRSRLEGAGTRATQELSDRQTAAVAGRVGAESQARGDYRKTKKSLTDQIQTLVGQKQADVMARFGQLVEADANRQKDIDVANIAANARRDVAAAGAKNKANTQAGKDAEKEQKRIAGIRKATGDMKQAVTDIAGQWDAYAGQTGYKKNPDKATNVEFPYLNPDGNPVKLEQSAAKVKMTPEQIRQKLINEDKVDAGLLHVALLVRAGKPLDQTAIRYIKANRDWRVPREWMPKSMTPKHLPDRYGGVGKGADTT